MWKPLLIAALALALLPGCGGQTADSPTANPPSVEPLLETETPTADAEPPTDIPSDTPIPAPTDTPPPPTPEPGPPTATLQPLNANSFPQGNVFGDELQFQTIASDPSVGSDNGAGIATVQFRIVDSQGKLVHENTERNPLYCAFGGGDDLQNCNVWRFSEYNNSWPNGTPVENGGSYQLQVTVLSQSGQQLYNELDFRIELP